MQRIKKNSVIDVLVHIQATVGVCKHVIVKDKQHVASYEIIN